MLKAKVLLPPAAQWDVGQLTLAVENAFDMAAKDVKVDFQTTTYTWDQQPAFVIEKINGGRAVYTTDQIYAWVNDGTPPHPIYPKNSGVLAFPGTFRPKTRPGAIRSNKGFQGGPTVFATGVQHPGTEARKFDEAIEAKWKDKFPQLLQRAVDAAIDRGSKS